MAIGLGGSVFLWSACDGSVQQLLELSSETDYISSVSWAGNGKYLAVGTSDAAIQVMTATAIHFKTNALCLSVSPSFSSALLSCGMLRKRSECV